MRLSNYELAELVYKAFKESFQLKDDKYLKNNNPLRSAYFVSLIEKKLEPYFEGAKIHFQVVESNGTKSKKRENGYLIFA